MQLSKLLYKNIFWRGLNMASVFVLNVLIAQVFGATLYGQLFFFINSLAFALLVVSFSLDSGFLFYGAKNELNTSTAVILAFVWAIAGAILVYLLYLIIGTAKQSGVQSLMYVSGMLLLTFFSALYTAKHNYILPNLIIVIINGVLAILLFFCKDDFEKFNTLFFIAVLAQGLIIGLGYCIKYIKSFKIELPNKAEVLKIVKYASVAFLGNILFFLVYRVDYWFVDYFIADKQQLGNYIQVSKVGQLFIILPSIIASTIFAVTAEGKKEDMHLKIVKVSKLIFVFVVLASTPLVLFGNWIFPFVFGKTFVFMYEPFLWLLPGVIALAIQAPFAAFNAGLNKQKANFLATILALVIIIIGDLYLIPIAGIKGAALASSIGYSCCGVYLLSCYKKSKIYSQS